MQFNTLQETMGAEKNKTQFGLIFSCLSVHRRRRSCTFCRLIWCHISVHAQVMWLLFPAFRGLELVNLNLNKSEIQEKICNLLHRGRGVQGGREVREVQAGRGYHHYQRDQQDPGGERERKKEGVRLQGQNKRVTWTSTVQPVITWLFLLHHQSRSLWIIFNFLCVPYSDESSVTPGRGGLIMWPTINRLVVDMWHPDTGGG